MFLGLTYDYLPRQICRFFGHVYELLHCIKSTEINQNWAQWASEALLGIENNWGILKATSKVRIPHMHSNLTPYH